MTDMRIVELGDCSMVIMKDSEDPPWTSVGDVYRYAKKSHLSIMVSKKQSTSEYLTSTDFVYTAGRLVLFFKDSVPSTFKLHDKVSLQGVYDDTILMHKLKKLTTNK